MRCVCVCVCVSSFVAITTRVSEEIKFFQESLKWTMAGTFL